METREKEEIDEVVPLRRVKPFTEAIPGFFFLNPNSSLAKKLQSMGVLTQNYKPNKPQASPPSSSPLRKLEQDLDIPPRKVEPKNTTKVFATEDAKPEKPHLSPDRDYDHGFNEMKKKRSVEEREGHTNESPPFIPFHGVQMGDRMRVRVTRVIYNALRLKLMHEGGHGTTSSPSEGVRRADLTAGSKMSERHLYINTERRTGSIPGVNIGDIFFYRMEMCVIGLHKPTMAGIDYTIMSGYGSEKVALSIISSGGYEDDEDAGGDGQTLIYTGQGGQADNKGQQIKQAVDQKLERGNLALSNNIKYRVPVRVIRGIDHPELVSCKIYVYDGLYMVERYWYSVGKAGYGVYKFKLQRLPDQPPACEELPVPSTLMKQCATWVKLNQPFSHPLSKKGYKVFDVAQRQEEKPVYFWCRDERLERQILDFDYVKTVSYTTFVKNLKPTKGCDCRGKCTKESCYCIRRNGGVLPYSHNGCLIKNKIVVYECGSPCSCPPDCQCRLTQKGLKWRLEVFETDGKGLGVRSWEPIPAGSFVCEYAGVAGICDPEHEMQINDSRYVLFSSHKLSGNGIDFGAHELVYEGTKGAFGSSGRSSIVIDCSKKGNVSRFMNHSCFPNLFQQFVLYRQNDTYVPHVMLFAIENIPPMTELTFDYNERVPFKDRKSGKKCLCGEKGCRGHFF